MDGTVVSAFLKALSSMTADRLIAPELDDLELTATLSLLMKKPYSYRDEATGQLFSTRGIRGMSSILIINRIIDLRAIRDSVRQVSDLGGEITLALCRTQPTKSEADGLNKMGIPKVQTV